jgi:hypothetical protein
MGSRLEGRRYRTITTTLSKLRAAVRVLLLLMMMAVAHEWRRGEIMEVGCYEGLSRWDLRVIDWRGPRTWVGMGMEPGCGQVVGGLGWGRVCPC